MSIASQWHRLRNPRILAIPLTRPVPNLSAATNPDAKLDSKMLMFYQFRLNGHRKPVLSFLPQEGVGNWLKENSASAWARFGKAEGWRRMMYNSGERLMDKMEFEELALRRVDPALGRNLWWGTEKEKEEALETGSVVPLLYSPSLMSASAALNHLRRHVEYRIMHHRKWSLRYLALCPLAFLLKYIPMVSYFPLYYYFLRFASHFEAHRGAAYVKFLLDNNLIEPEPSKVLDGIYEEFSPRPFPGRAQLAQPDTARSTSSSASSSSNSDTRRQHTLLLTCNAVPALLSKFGLTEAMVSADLYRAIRQVRARAEIGKLKF